MWKCPGYLSTRHTSTISSRFSGASPASPGFEILYLAENHLVAPLEARRSSTSCRSKGRRSGDPTRRRVAGGRGRSRRQGPARRFKLPLLLPPTSDVRQVTVKEGERQQAKQRDKHECDAHFQTSGSKRTPRYRSKSPKSTQADATQFDTAATPSHASNPAKTATNMPASRRASQYSLRALSSRLNALAWPYDVPQLTNSTAVCRRQSTSPLRPGKAGPLQAGDGTGPATPSPHILAPWTPNRRES